MLETRNFRFLWCISILSVVCLVAFPAYAKYSGGTGEPNDPYQIATAADLIALGETPEDYDKHFILTADIDLDPNLPGREVFDRAVIAPGVSLTSWGSFQGTPFIGVFDGKGHTISRLTIAGSDYLGLFGQLGSGARVSNLGLEAVRISGTGSCIGSLVGANGGYPSGNGSITNCHSTASVSGGSGVGGLVGSNEGRIANCFCSGSVSGDSSVGGLVGFNGSEDYWPEVIQCYSSATVGGTGWYVGGLVGRRGYDGAVTSSFWDTQTSGQAESAGGTGKTTAEMQDPNTFKAAGWDFVGLSDGPHDIWAMPEGGGYPVLWWQLSPLPELPSFSGGTGEPNDPYIIAAAEELNSIGHNPRLMNCHVKLVDDLDLSGCLFHPIGGVDYPYVGVFDGGGHTVSHLTLTGEDFLGLFGHMAWGATVKDLGVLDVNIVGTGYNTGGLVGTNGSSYRYPFTEGGLVLNCYSSGSVIATREDSHVFVGGLVGYNAGSVVSSHSSSSVTDTGRYSCSGGLVGGNVGSITTCYSTGSVGGTSDVGGLVGYNNGSITTTYSTGSVSGKWRVGGLVGGNWGSITVSHSAGEISGTDSVGGLAGQNWGIIAECTNTATVSATGDDVGGVAGRNTGTITQCHNGGAVSGAGGNGFVGGLVGHSISGVTTGSYNTGRISGSQVAGGLVGYNKDSTVTDCYNTGAVSAHYCAGGTLGFNHRGFVIRCYSSGSVSGTGLSIGGLVGNNYQGSIIASFWDIQTSGRTWSDGGTAKTTAEMQTAKTFLDAGWDFVGETANGTEDIWKIAEGLDYPRLWWEPYDGRVTVVLGQVFTVTLESNPSTGYRWEWVDHQDSIVEQIGEAQFKPRETGDPPLVGAGGWESFDFKAVHPGQMTLKLVYRRPWEEGVEPLKTFSLQVTVP